MQAGKITTNIRVKIYITLPELSAEKIMAWYCHVNDSYKGRYYMVLGKDILTALGLNLKLSKHVRKADYGTFKVSTAPWLIWVRMNLKI